MVLVWFGFCLIPIGLALAWLENGVISFLSAGGWAFPSFPGNPFPSTGLRVGRSLGPVAGPRSHRVLVN